MKKLIASTLVLALAMLAAPINLIAAARFQAGSISGVATVDGKPLANVTVRLRNVDTGQLVGTTTSNASGQFSFSGLQVGNFVVETVAANGTILGTSATIVLTAAALAATGITVATTGTALAAAGVATGAGVAAAGGGGLAAVGGALGAVAIAGGAIAAVATVVVLNDASPSQ